MTENYDNRMRKLLVFSTLQWMFCVKSVNFYNIITTSGKMLRHRNGSFAVICYGELKKTDFDALSKNITIQESAATLLTIY